MGQDSDDKLDVLRPRIGRANRARERVASSPYRVATLVRRGHGGLRANRTRLPPTAGFGPRQRARRVVVKAHVQKLGGQGAQAAARHLRYIERDGVEKNGSRACFTAPRTEWVTSGHVRRDIAFPSRRPRAIVRRLG